MALNKNIPPSLMTLALGLLVVYMFMQCGAKRSKYVLKPQALNVQSAVTPDSIFDLKTDISCVPGPTSAASYYTVGLTPAGVCGAQEWVAKQADGYKIIGGIGDSLLSQ
jgi:hypothetical protein